MEGEAGVDPVSVAAKGPCGQQRRPRMKKHADWKDETRQWLLKRVKRLMRNPWLFRGLMLAWKVYDYFHRE